MSDMSQGPGWWIASDGKWYPPQSHPDAMASPVLSEPEPFVPGEAPAGPPPVASGSKTTGRRRATLPWVLLTVAVAGLAVAALVVALTSGSGSPSSIGGAGTVTFQITVDQAGSSSFAGTVGGNALRGTATVAQPSGPGTTSGTSTVFSPVFTYKGELGGTSYVLHAMINALPSQSGSQDAQVTFAVTGTYGSQPVTATAMFDLSSVSQESETVSFNGHIGTRPIRGVATATDTNGKTTITGTVNAVPTA